MEPLRINKWHRDILGNPRPETRQTLGTTIALASVLEALSSKRLSLPAIQSRQRVNVDGLYYRYGNGVSLFLRWGNVTVGSERIPSLETRRN